MSDTGIKEKTSMIDHSGKYLSFTLAHEEYGINILHIKEIIGMMQITSVPKTPEYVKGVINLRGKVIPIIDLRLKFEVESVAYTERTCIIVVEIISEDGLVTIGIVVDAVSDVLNIDKDHIEPPPEFGARLDTEFILGMAKHEKGVKILLDINKVLASQEVETISNLNQTI